MEGIQVSIEKAGLRRNIAVIKVGGYIDTTTSAEFEHSLNSLIKSNCYNIIIDLGNVDYISSAGWGIIISEIKGIRENGGDLKLARMIPDVYEVFELLEFHNILKAYNTLDEAINDFDDSRHAVLPSYTTMETDEQTQEEVREVSEPETEVLSTQPESVRPHKRASNTIEEKIRLIVVENPEVGTIQIMKTLNSSRFGNIKLGWFAIRKYLKKLNLDSKKKRIEYFKQMNFGKV